MSAGQDERKERAFEFDLFVSTGWVDRFDQLVSEHVELPDEGRLLSINCGTGDNVLALAAKLKAGEVVGTDADAERLAIARAKAIVAKAEKYEFVEADPRHLDFADGTFAGVLLDATFESPADLSGLTAEALRVAAPGAPVVVTITGGGSFDEFYSLLWEALHDVGIADSVWPRIEPIVLARPKAPEAVEILRAAGLRYAKPHVSKEEWRFESPRELLDSPLAAMLFIDASFAEIPESDRGAVSESLERILEREIGGKYFPVSAKALAVAGKKA
ncbi:MAG: methyltransferase domain-containing protein [Acidobacteria bacterium]|nr:methyltransferase domain-containing protein [Acidobacteriota bacterium]